MVQVLGYRDEQNSSSSNSMSSAMLLASMSLESCSNSSSRNYAEVLSYADFCYRQNWPRVSDH